MDSSKIYPKGHFQRQDIKLHYQENVQILLVCYRILHKQLAKNEGTQLGSPFLFHIHQITEHRCKLH